MSFGDRLAALRMARGLSQAELAKKVGITQGAIGNYETGSSPKQEIADKLAEFFNIPVADLMNGRLLSRNEYNLFAEEATEALYHLTKEDQRLLGIDAPVIRRALNQRVPIREDRARELAQEIGLNYDLIMRDVIPPGEAYFEPAPIDEAEKQLLDAFRQLNDAGRHEALFQVRHLLSKGLYVKSDLPVPAVGS